MEKLEHRKKDHIDLVFKSGTVPSDLDRRFYYEPLLQPHPSPGFKPFPFLGKEQRVPMWVSSMTGGTKLAATINRNLALACHEFGMGMGLGSCRIILDDDSHFEDFNMRQIIGEKLPLWANLGIAQVEDLVLKKQLSKVERMVEKLKADGLIVHVNPMQEWFQPEGDLLSIPPLETIKGLLDQANFPLIVKEVGQGLGPESLRELLRLPLQAIEFGAFGGSNFAKVELLRNDHNRQALFEPLSRVGEDALTMLNHINQMVSEEEPICKELIISGGVKTFLDGYYLIKKSTLSSVYGMASTFLNYAREDYSLLRDYVQSQVSGLEMAEAYLTIRE